MTKVTVCVTTGDVSRNTFNCSLRTRITKATKKAYEKLAQDRRVKEAQLYREAAEMYLEAQAAKKEASR